MSKFVYADNAATTPVSREVFEAMRPCFELEYGNPSSLHQMGRAARELLDCARERIAAKSAQERIPRYCRGGQGAYAHFRVHLRQDNAQEL